MIAIFRGSDVVSLIQPRPALRSARCPGASHAEVRSPTTGRACSPAGAATSACYVSKAVSVAGDASPSRRAGNVEKRGEARAPPPWALGSTLVPGWLSECMGRMLQVNSMTV